MVVVWRLFSNEKGPLAPFSSSKDEVLDYKHIFTCAHGKFNFRKQIRKYIRICVCMYVCTLNLNQREMPANALHFSDPLSFSPTSSIQPAPWPIHIPSPVYSGSMSNCVCFVAKTMRILLMFLYHLLLQHIGCLPLLPLLLLTAPMYNIYVCMLHQLTGQLMQLLGGPGQQSCVFY